MITKNRILNGVDIEGCFNPGHGESPNPFAVSVLKEYIKKNIYPKLFFCTSASTEYTEGIIQSIMGKDIAQQIELPLQVCEGGAAFFNCRTWKVEFHPEVDRDSKKDVKKLEDAVLDKVNSAYAIPRAIMSSVCSDLNIEELYVITKEIAKRRGYKVGISHSASTLDITPFSDKGKGITKWDGIVYVCEEFAQRTNQELNPLEIGYIGDAMGDLAVLGKVKYPFCPSNASNEVKTLVKQRQGVVSKHKDIETVLEMFGLRKELKDILSKLNNKNNK